MNFSLLGDDPAALPLLRAIASHPVHKLSHAVAVKSPLPEILEWSPSVRVGRQWDELLPADAVVVAGSDDLVLEGAKRLAAAGKPLLVYPRADQGATWIYELTLIRDDTQALLCPVFPHRVHPALRRLRELMDDGSLGTLLHLQLEREVRRGNGPDSPPFLVAADIEAALLPDVDLLRSLCGDYNQVTALYSGQTTDRVSLARVTLAGDHLPEALWSLKAGPAKAGWRLTVTGSEATACLAGGRDPSEITLEMNGSEQPADSATGEFDSGRALLERFEAALAGERVPPDWTDLTHAFETVDAARRSVARRRTIDLYFETPSERSIFKTQMTAMGCGLLMLTLVGVVVLLMAGALFDVNETVMRVARVLVFLPLFLFLLLQLLLFLTRPSSRE